MHFVKKVAVVSLALFIGIMGSTAVCAVSFEFPVTIKAAFDKMMAGANQATKVKLTKHYADVQAIQKEEAGWDTKINALHYRNEEALLAVRKRINEIDNAKVERLEAEVKRTKEKYKPILALYDTLNKQLSVVRSSKSKELTALLRTQTESAKIAAQLAKQDIRVKEDVLKNAKTARTATKKRINGVLADINPLKVKIKAARSIITTSNKQFNTEAKVLNQAVKKGDSAGTLSSFAKMIAEGRKIIDQKSKIYAYEQQIGAVIVKVEGQITK